MCLLSSLSYHSVLPHDQHQLLVHSATPPVGGQNQLAKPYRRVLLDLVKTGCVYMHDSQLAPVCCCAHCSLGCNENICHTQVGLVPTPLHLFHDAEDSRYRAVFFASPQLYIHMSIHTRMLRPSDYQTPSPLNSR